MRQLENLIIMLAARYDMSIGVWVGLIALSGVDAETAVFLMLYLDLAYDQARQDGRLQNLGEAICLVAAGPGQRHTLESA